MSSTEVEDFTSSLNDLHINSKPHINMLTMLAEENIVHAPAIVQAVEKHLNKVPSEIKLPVLYLIDSIVKNVGQDYISLFTQNIVSTFCSVFEKVDEKTRSQMFKLRQTWNDVFSAKKLYALDVRVHAIDPAWPITAPQPPNIHFNPKFLHPSSQPQIGLQEDPHIISEAMMREQLLKKQKELLELQQKKLELELIATKAKLEEQQKQLDRQTGSLHAEQVQQLLLPALQVVGQEAAKLLSGPKKLNPTLPLVAALKGTTNLTNRITQLPAQPNAEPNTRPRDPRLARQQPAAIPPTTAPPLDPIVTPKAPLPSSSVLPATVPQAVTASAPVPVPAVTSSATSQAHTTPITNTSTPVFEPVKMVDAAKSKPQITINLANKALNKEHRGVTKKDPRLLSSNKNISNTSSSNSNSLPSTSTNNNKGRLKGKESPTPPSPSSSPRKTKINTSNNSRNKIPKISKVIDLTASPPPKSHTSTSNEHSNSHHNKTASPIKSDSRKKKSNTSDKKKSTKSSNDSSNNSKRSTSPQSKKKRDRGRESPIIKYEVLDVDSPSPPPPPVISDKDKSKPVFKDVKVSAKGRNYMRRNNRAESASPEPATSSDVDLRVPPEKQVRMESDDTKNTGDVDLRQIPGSPAKKRPSLEQSDQPNKKTKADKFDILFGNEDVDLRKLAPPPPNQQTQGPNTQSQSKPPPSPPPPPVISGPPDGNWAKYKEARKPEGVIDSPRKRTHSNRDSFDRLGRPLLYHRLSSDERRTSADNSETCNGRDDNAKMNLIMSQADEQLASGSLSIGEYNTLVKEVIHMNEERKLQEARRREMEKENWDDEFIGAPQFSPCSDTSETSHVPPPPHQSQQPPQHPPRFGDIDERFQITTSSGPIPPGPPPPPTPVNANVVCPPNTNNNNGGGFWEQPTSRWDTPPRAWGPGPMGPIPPRMVHPGPGFHRPPNEFPPGNFARMPRWRGGYPPQGPLGPTRMPFDNEMERFDRFGGGRFVRAPQPPQPPPQSVVPAPAAAPSPVTGHIPMQQTVVPSKSELPPADPKVLDKIAQDSMRTINIDGVPREIRFYNETAIVMMSWDDPREIGFQDGARRVIFDDRESITCAFGEPYREIVIDGQTHRVRLGAPTRELYIDGQWYECFFGGPPIKVELSGKVFVVNMEGPAPQVKIGLVRRNDLCAGKINLIINARTMVPVFLDAKPQRFDIEGKPHVLRFADALRTVLINGKPFKVEFGGLPKPIHVRDKKHFIRFSVLPHGVTPGFVNIRDMEGSRLPSPAIPRPLQSEEVRDDETSNDANKLQPPPQQGHDPAMPMIGRKQRRPQVTDEDSQPEPESSSEATKTGKTGHQLPLDMLSSLIPSQMAPASGFGYQVDPESRPKTTPSISSETPDAQSSTNSNVTSILPKEIDVSALFQRLVATGIVPLNQPVANAAAAMVAAAAVAASVPSAVNKDETSKETEDLTIKNVDFAQPDTLKIRQPGIISLLYSGIQCSSCGVRFPPEQTMKYSQHLDWHFRQNRRDKDSARHAHSRKWYYDVSDWIQFEEIEDLEERAQSWFETQQAAEGKEAVNEEPQAILSVPAGKVGENTRCEMCHDRFDQFYNEESEEWHLKNAIRIEDKIFHPLCYEDFKTSLQTSMESIDCELIKPEIENVQNNDEKTPEKMEVDVEVKKEEDTDKAMDVDVTLPEKVERKEENDVKTEENNKENIEEEKETSDNIKEEEKDNLSKSDEVLTCEEQKDIFSQEMDETLPTIEPLPDTTLAAVASSIDGNVQYDAEPTLTAPTTKIKINISKPLPIPVSENTISGSGDTSESDKAELSESDEVPLPPPQPKLVKEKMQGRTFIELPPVSKDRELSGLCSIM